MSITISLRAPEGEKSEFIGASSLFSVSMGVDKILMQGICLEKTIEIINRTFSKCDIVISDALQKFNLMTLYPELKEEKALAMAIAIGDGWLEKNQYLLAELSIPYNVFRWSDWLSLPTYQDKYSYVNNLFQKDKNFQTAVESSVKIYFDRKAKSKNDIQYIYLESHLAIAYNFVLEEAAVMLLWCDAEYDFELHPSKRSPALTYLHDIYYGFKKNRKLKQGRIKILGSHDELLKVV